MHIGIIVIASLLLIGAVGWGFIYNYAVQEKVPEDVFVEGIPLGGMLIEDALDKIEGINNSLQKRTITLQANTAAEDSKKWVVAELGYKSEVIGLRPALLKLREGGIWDRAVYRYHFEKSYVFKQSWNGDILDAAIRKQWSWIEKNQPMDASRTITENDEVVYEPHSDAYRLDLTSLIKQVNDWVVLKKEQLGVPIEQAFKADLPITVVHPKVTLESLKAEGIERKIMSFSTDFKTSAEGRAYNVMVTAEALNDWHLAPNEVFDYGKLIARAEELYEYREAPVILNGTLVPGIGGGICQVSSTLYNAVLLAGLGIEERRNHSIPVSYLPLGQDATYSGGSINFKFKNTTGKHIIIRTEVKDRKLTVKLFGTMDAKDSYAIDSVTVKTIEPTIKETVSSVLSTGQTRTVQHGKQGYVVETYLTHFSDGEVVSRKKISRDTYKAQPTLIERGPMKGGVATPTPDSSPTNPPLLEDGL